VTEGLVSPSAFEAVVVAGLYSCSFSSWDVEKFGSSLVDLVGVQFEVGSICDNVLTRFLIPGQVVIFTKFFLPNR
jgi:hypothetical protein